MRQGRRWRIIPVMLCLFAMLASQPTAVWAGTWDKAVTYYNKYGNAVVFRPTSTTDGIIYYATKASTATTTTRYRTIGWKMTVKDLDGTKLQTIYYKLGGPYMTKVDSATSSGYEYNLYSLSLYNVKRRLNAKASKAMGNGEADITLDACMVVVKKGKAQGAMNDSGPSSGTVYTTYKGISGAESWSSSAKSSLKNYFNKTVDGLFVKVTASSDTGISKIDGEGYYCYGTYVTLTATCKKGYDFEQWNGSTRSTRTSISFYATEEKKWFATTTKKQVEVVFHRNLSSSDTKSDTQKIIYGDNGTRFYSINWRKNGQELIGWALSPGTSTVSYSTTYIVTNTWILDNAPKLNLYAVYKQPTPSTQTPTPSTPTPSTQTPSTQTPTPSTQTPTPSTQTPTPSTQTPTPSTQTPTPSTQTPTPDTQTTEDETGTPTRKLRVRFISSKYFEDTSQNLVSSAKGGLAADSKWAVDPALRALLREVLAKT